LVRADIHEDVATSTTNLASAILPLGILLVRLPDQMLGTHTPGVVAKVGAGEVWAGSVPPAVHQYHLPGYEISSSFSTERKVDPVRVALGAERTSCCVAVIAFILNSVGHHSGMLHNLHVQEVELFLGQPC
jgi:hypothetical protein